MLKEGRSLRACAIQWPETFIKNHEGLTRFHQILTTPKLDDKTTYHQKERHVHFSQPPLDIVEDLKNFSRSYPISADIDDPYLKRSVSQM